MTETIILIRRSGISGSVPPSGSLKLGELALNMTDGGLFYHDTGSDSVELIRAGTASFALNAGGGGGAGVFGGDFSGTFSGSVTGPITGTFLGDGAQITGIVSAAFAAFATSASFAETASFALNAGAGGGDGGTTSSFVTLTFGTAVREIVQLTSSVILSGSQETGSINLGRTFVLHRISGSAETRVRIYSSESFRDADTSRAIGTDPTGEHGVIIDAVLSGSPNFLVLDLAPYVIGADAKTVPDGVVAYTLDDLTGTAITHSFEFTRLQFEAQNTGTILDRDNITLDTAILSSGSFETGSVGLGLMFNLLEASASSDARIRLYTTPTFRDADLSRGVGVDPIGEHGVILDLVVTGTFNDFQLAPLVLGASLETPATEAIAYTVQNRTSTALSVSIDFTRIRIENQPIVTQSGGGGGGGTLVIPNVYFNGGVGGNNIVLPDTAIIPSSVAISVYTLETWINPIEYTAFAGPFALGTGGDSFLWHLNGGGTQDMFDGGGVANGGKVVPRNAWTHIALAVTGTVWELYFNGLLETSGTGQTAITVANGRRIAGDGAGATEQIFGFLSDLRFWTVKRTPSEIFDNYRSRLGGSEVGLAGYWKLDEDPSSSIAFNSSAVSGSDSGTLEGGGAGNTGSLFIPNMAPPVFWSIS